jgi:hypothetical protein
VTDQTSHAVKFKTAQKSHTNSNLPKRSKNLDVGQFGIEILNCPNIASTERNTRLRSVRTVAVPHGEYSSFSIRSQGVLAALQLLFFAFFHRNGAVIFFSFRFSLSAFPHFRIFSVGFVGVSLGFVNLRG